MAKKKEKDEYLQRKDALLNKLKKQPEREKRVSTMQTAFLITLECATQVAMGRDKPRYQEIGDKYGVSLLTAKRLWTEVPNDLKTTLINNANDVLKQSVERMVVDKAEEISKLEDKTILLAHKASDILMERMNKAPHDIADRDLIGLLTKVLSMAKENNAIAEGGTQIKKAGNVYNIIDQSITNNYE